MKIEEYEINEFLANGGLKELQKKFRNLNIDLDESFGFNMALLDQPTSLSLDLEISQLQTRESRRLQEFIFSVPYDIDQVGFDSLIEGFLAIKKAFSFRHEWYVRSDYFSTIAMSSSVYSDESPPSSVRELERIKRNIINLIPEKYS